MTETARDDARTELPSSSSYATWLRTMAVLYDPFLWLGEIAGMRRLRHALLADVRGRVVEIGSGTGLNVTHYPDTVDDLVLTEPEPGMHRRLARRVDRSGRAASVLDASADRLPLADGSVDVVVSTLVLCTVDDAESVLREIGRVLRPGGQLLFIEHVRARSPRLAAWQDRLMRPWRGFAGGCVCNRRTLELMRACGFKVEVEDAVWRGMPAIVHPLAVGRATRIATPRDESWRR
jgi:SAM-dependent methyltransferase